jgi:RNA polymerase sigma-70 factor (ECF subfamily)
MASSAGITQLLERWSERGEEARDDELMVLVYYELHQLAVSYLHRELRDDTLPPTALVNELFLKLSAQHSMSLHNRTLFLGVMAQLMRRILIDYARAHHASKSSSDRHGILLEDIVAFGSQPEADLLSVHVALNRLEEIAPDKARVVELRIFGGLTIEETAEAMGISPATVKRNWTFAKAYLRRELVRVPQEDVESDAWRALSAKRLQDAYAEDEEDYSLVLINEPNTEYESR